MTSVKALLGWARPHLVDRMGIAVIAAGFGLGVFLLAWQGERLRMIVGGSNVTWTVLVAFGVTWLTGSDTAWRTGFGILFGVLAAISAFYGTVGLLPVTPMGVGIGLAVAAGLLAVIAHVFPQVVSFGGASVGYGAGIATALAFPLGPTTSAADLGELMSGSILAVLLGVLSALSLRALMALVARSPRRSRAAWPQPTSMLRIPKRREAAARSRSAAVKVTQL